MSSGRPNSAKLINRVMRDIADVKKCADLKLCGVVLNTSTSMREMTASIGGPPMSLYEGVSFIVEVKLPTFYPYDPPKNKFLTNIWHPNVDSRNGYICVDVLKEKWSPSLTLAKALLSVQNLLENPESDSPQDIAVGVQMRRCRTEFLRTARVWAKEYGVGDAAQGDTEFEAILDRLLELGNVWRGSVLRYLSENEWNMNDAVAHFFPDVGS